MSIELMLNGANLAFITFARQFDQTDGQIYVFFIITLAAAEVTLKEILTDQAYEKSFALNKKLVDGYTAIIREHKLPCYANGVGAMGTINFRKDRIRNYRDFMESDPRAWHAYFIAMLNEGILPQAAGSDEQWTISVQHTEADIDTHLKTFGKVAPMLRAL